jgi:hypothetical protein
VSICLHTVTLDISGAMIQYNLTSGVGSPRPLDLALSGLVDKMHRNRRLDARRLPDLHEIEQRGNRKISLLFRLACFAVRCSTTSSLRYAMCNKRTSMHAQLIRKSKIANWDQVGTSLLLNSDFCSFHKIDDTSTSEILRIVPIFVVRQFWETPFLLRAMWRITHALQDR